MLRPVVCLDTKIGAHTIKTGHHHACHIEESAPLSPKVTNTQASAAARPKERAAAFPMQPIDLACSPWPPGTYSGVLFRGGGIGLSLLCRLQSRKWKAKPCNTFTMLGQGLAKASLVSQCALVVSTRAARRGDQPQIPMPFSPVPALLLARPYTLTGEESRFSKPEDVGKLAERRSRRQPELPLRRWQPWHVFQGLIPRQTEHSTDRAFKLVRSSGSQP